MGRPCPKRAGTDDNDIRHRGNLSSDVRLWSAAMEQAIPILPAEDLSVAKTFYVDGLGFRVTFEASEDGRTGLLGVSVDNQADAG